MTRNYVKSVYTQLDTTVINAGSGDIPLKGDGIFANAFSDIAIYSDSGYTVPISASAYEATTTDNILTASEAEAGGSGKTVSSEYAILDPTYQTGTIYVRVNNFGTYTNGNTVGQSVTPITANTAYTSLSDAYLDIFTATGLGADITITVTDGGGDERNQIKVINNDSTYSVWVKDSVTATILWEVEPRKKELFYMDGALNHGPGKGLVWKGSNQYIADASLLEGKPNNGDSFKGLLYYTVGNQYVEVAITIGNNTSYNTSAEYVGPTATSYDGPANTFDSRSTSYPFVKLWRLYD